MMIAAILLGTYLYRCESSSSSCYSGERLRDAAIVSWSQCTSFLSFYRCRAKYSRFSIICLTRCRWQNWPSFSIHNKVIVLFSLLSIALLRNITSSLRAFWFFIISLLNRVIYSSLDILFLFLSLGYQSLWSSLPGAMSLSQSTICSCFFEFILHAVHL